MEFKDRERILLYLVIAVVGLFLADRLVSTPLIHLWKERSAHIEKLREDLRNGHMLISRADAIETRWEEMKRRGLPRERPAAEEEVLANLNRWTQDSHVAVKSLKLPWRQSDSGTPRLEVSASAEGDMRSIARFLYDLEMNPLATRLLSLELSARDNRGRGLTMEARWSSLRPEDES